MEWTKGTFSLFTKVLSTDLFIWISLLSCYISDKFLSGTNLSGEKNSLLFLRILHVKDGFTFTPTRFLVEINFLCQEEVISLLSLTWNKSTTKSVRYTARLPIITFLSVPIYILNLKRRSRVLSGDSLLLYSVSDLRNAIRTQSEIKMKLFIQTWG